MAMILPGAKAGGLPCCEILWVAAVRVGLLDGGGGAKATSPSWLQLAPKVSSTVGLAAGAPIVRPWPFCCHFGAGGAWQSEGPPSGPGKRPEREMVVQRASPYLVTHGTPQSGFYAPCPNADRLHCASEKQGSCSSLLKPTFPSFPSPNIFGDQKKKSRTRLNEAEQNGRGAQDTTLCTGQSSHFLLNGWEPTQTISPKLHSPSICPFCLLTRKATDRAWQSRCWNGAKATRPLGSADTCPLPLICKVCALQPSALALVPTAPSCALSSP